MLNRLVSGKTATMKAWISFGGRWGLTQAWEAITIFAELAGQTDEPAEPTKVQSMHWLCAIQLQQQMQERQGQEVQMWQLRQQINSRLHEQERGKQQKWKAKLRRPATGEPQGPESVAFLQ